MKATMMSKFMVKCVLGLGTILPFAGEALSKVDAQIVGSVEHFAGYIYGGDGSGVEPLPYSYYAIATEDGQRLAVPAFLSAETLAVTKDTLSIDAEVEPNDCGSSKACVTDSLIDIKGILIEGPDASAKESWSTFTGKMQHFAGQAVENPSQSYSYYALAGSAVGVPHVVGEELLKFAADAKITVVGIPLSLPCTDMSAACGATFIEKYATVEILFP